MGCKAFIDLFGIPANQLIKNKAITGSDVMSILDELHKKERNSILNRFNLFYL